MNFEEFKKLAMAKSFIELYQHYFRLFLVAKGYFSKNLSYNTFHGICRRFCEIIQFPSEILEDLQAERINLDVVRVIDNNIIELMSKVSEDDIITAFSQLKITR